MMSTIIVVIETSLRVGQVTLATSCLTSCINAIGFNFAINLLSLAHMRQLAATCPRVSGAGATSRCGTSGRGGRARTCDLRFWRPTLYQLSYAPTSDSNTALEKALYVPGSVSLDQVNWFVTCGLQWFFQPLRWTIEQPHAECCSRKRVSRTAYHSGTSTQYEMRIGPAVFTPTMRLAN